MSKIRAAELLATWFGCGYAPAAPGTFGALGALLPAMLLCVYGGWPFWSIALLGVAIIPPAIWSATVTAKARERKDPGLVVVDEVAGQWITIAGMHGQPADSWKAWLLAFLLFRIFDIVKPWPVKQFEALPDGTGIVMDDVMAGVYGAVVLYGLGWFNLL